MEDKKHSDPTVFIIFGASGDLTWRKLVPALYNLYLGGWMPEKFEVIGMSYDEMSDEKFQDHLKDGVNQFSRQGMVKDEEWKIFAQCLHFTNVDLNDAKIYKDLAKMLSAKEKKWGAEATRIFYLALPRT